MTPTVRVAHLVNPVRVKPPSDLYRAQPVTFASIQAACAFASETCDVSVLAACYPEDEDVAPAWVQRTPLLDRSILDTRTFERDRKLPLLRDLIERLPRDVDLCIYSNVDIALMPHFYLTVARWFEEGIDGMVINRRTITNRWGAPDDLPNMYAELGEPHPGRDCFVFRPEAIDDFDLGDVIIGAGDVGRVLAWNVALTASRFEWFRDHHVTFHIGDDRAWDQLDLYDYHDHNNDEAIAVLGRLEDRHGPLRGRFPINELLPRPRGYWRRLRYERENPPGFVVRQARRVWWRLRRMLR